MTTRLDSHSASHDIANSLTFPQILKDKRLLLATESLGQINGVSRTTNNLLEYLRNNGVDVAVVAPQTKGLRSLKTAGTGGQGVEVRLTGYPLPYDPTLSVVFPFRIDRLYKRTFQPDLIYLASPASLGFQILLQLRVLREKPPVLLNFQTDLSAYCKILFPTPLDHWAVWVFRSVQGYLFRYPIVRTIFYPSSEVRDYIEAANVPGEKLVNLRRGVDANLFNPSRRDESFRMQIAPNKEIILVTVCRLAPEKGFGFLSQVARALDEKKIDFKLVIVGSNRSVEVQNEIYSMFTDLRNQGKVIFTGLLQGEDLARAYASGDIFIHSSITETFGLVVLEAMSSGVSVVARAKGGPCEIVHDGETGYLVREDDLSGCVSKIEDLAKDPELRRRMGAKGREIAIQATWERINHKVATYLASALERKIAAAASASATRRHAPEYIWDKYGTRPILSFISDVIEYTRISRAVIIISWIWVGLVITYILVRISLLVRAIAGPKIGGK